MNSKLPLNTVLGIFSTLSGGFDPFLTYKEKEKRPCLQCGKLKQHNNSFCSADCCRAYKLKSRDKK